MEDRVHFTLRNHVTRINPFAIKKQIVAILKPYLNKSMDKNTYWLIRDDIYHYLALCNLPIIINDKSVIVTINNDVINVELSDDLKKYLEEDGHRIIQHSLFYYANTVYDTRADVEMFIESVYDAMNIDDKYELFKRR